jgi:hypothetical protein
MKPESNQPTQCTQSTPSKRPRLDDAARCWHHSPSGRRCRMPICRSGERLCYEHRAQYKKQDAFDLKKALLFDHEGFQTAQGINSALRNLYGLLANNYISPRRASVLAYISSLLLRTLPAIDADGEAGITDPGTGPESSCDSDADLQADSGPKADSASETINSEFTPTAEPAQSSSRPPATESADAAWPESIPEPDPSKKPS